MVIVTTGQVRDSVVVDVTFTPNCGTLINQDLFVSRPLQGGANTAHCQMLVDFVCQLCQSYVSGS